MHANFQVREEGTLKLVVDSVTPQLNNTVGSKAATVLVPPSWDPQVWFTVAYLNPGDDSVTLVCDDELGENREPLSPGAYQVTLSLDVAGYPTRQEQRFVVDHIRRGLTLG